MIEALKSFGRKVFPSNGSPKDKPAMVGKNNNNEMNNSAAVTRNQTHSFSNPDCNGHADTGRPEAPKDPENPCSSRKNLARGENGFEEWGGYMPAKKAKLDAQFNASKSESVCSTIFQGLSIYINGYTDPPEPQLREMFILHGGNFHPYNSAKTTFVIATNLSAPSKNLYASKTVKPEWITESIAAGTKLDPRKFMLYNLNEEKNQRTLTQLMEIKTAPAADSIGSRPNHVENSIISRNVNGQVNSSNLPKLMTDSKVTPNAETDDPSDFLVASEDEISPEEKKSNKNVPNKVPESSSYLGNTHRKVKMATEEGFLEEFFQNSRLHLISDQKKEMQNKIGHMRKNLATHTFVNLQLFEKECAEDLNSENVENGSFDEDVILMHIDLDCFFVSVGLLSRLHLRGKPVVVTHSTGKEGNSKADIASASYEARKFGVSNGMWVSDAKEMCPALEVIPYDFDEYRRVSEVFFETVASFTLDIEPCSVDEMVVNVTSLLKQVPGSTPKKLAQFIRKMIYEKTKCPASVGIGSNRLLAKLATKKAKPNGVYHLLDQDAQSFISELRVGELPGIGYSNEAKLSEFFGVSTCEDLLKVPLKDLKTKLGEKTAEKMLQFCMGKDTSELKYGFDRPKSISIDVNYGIRFTKEDEIHDFMIKLCKELASRAVRSQATATNLTVRILCRKKGAGEPKKHGGHGIVDTITRSGRFMQATNDWQEMYRNSTKIMKLLALPPTDYRGIALSLTSLRFEFDKSNLEKRSVQKTLFDLTTTSRGKQMVEFAIKAAETKELEVRRSNGFTKSPQSNGRPSSPEFKNYFEKAVHSDAKSATSVVQRGKKKIDSNGEVPESMRLPMNNLVKDKVDINVLRELPRDIAREMAQHYGISDAELTELDWLEEEEVRHDANLPVSDKSSLNGLSSAADAIESVIRQSAVGGEASRDTVNPYDVDTIDPSFLCALPDSIRNEVLLQFQEAKKVRGTENPSSAVVDEQQPCSSKQALERDRLLNGCSKIASPKQPLGNFVEYGNNVNNHNGKENGSDESLICDENMCEEEQLLTPSTPPSVRPVPSSSSRRRLLARSSITPTRIRSRKRLNFDEAEENQDIEESKNVGLLIKNDNSEYGKTGSPRQLSKIERHKRRIDFSKKAPIIKPQQCILPALNGLTDIEEVRNQIREGLDSVDNPLPEDVEGLRKYFHELVTRGCMKQTCILMKFLNRKLENLPPQSHWTSVLQDIISVTNKETKDLYNLQLSVS